MFVAGYLIQQSVVRSRVFRLVLHLKNYLMILPVLLVELVRIVSLRKHDNRGVVGDVDSGSFAFLATP